MERAKRRAHPRVLTLPKEGFQTIATAKNNAEKVFPPILKSKIHLADNTLR